MAYTNLPAQHAYLIDGNVGITAPAGAPRVLILGQAGRGFDYQPFTLSGDALAAGITQFGLDGDLARQAYECREGGGQSMVLNRVCALPLRMEYIGGTGSNLAERADGGANNGWTLECKYGGTEWGTRFGMSFETGSGRLVLTDRLLTITVYDNGTDNPVDIGLFDILGTCTANSTGGSDIGAYGVTLQGRTSIPLASATSSDLSMRWYGGDNGTNICRMRLFEGLYEGLKAVEGIPFDYVAFPEKATLDAPQGTTLWTSVARGTTYPTRNSLAYDKLGYVYTEEYQGKDYFYWSLANNGSADIWSAPGTSTSQYRVTSLGGHVYSSTDFHEANFAYLLAHNCYRITEDDHFAQGVCAVEPPSSYAVQAVATWIGTDPTYSTDIQGNVTVSANGNGLLGNKFMAGSTGFRNATSMGGFIASVEGWVDGAEVQDDNDHKVDIGKYISIFSTPSRYGDFPGLKAGYYTISPAAYAGFRTTLGAKSAPTNKPYPTRGLPFRISNLKLDKLAGYRYTMLYASQAGTFVSDAPTAARPDSDYQRQGSMNIVALVIQGLRQAGERYLGEYLTAEQEVALGKDLDEALMTLKKSGFIRDASQRLVITEDDRILGRATSYVDVIVPFELRRISFKISLRRAS